MDRVLDQRYRILRPLGAGGSSQVYLAQDTALGREVAVKVLDDQANADGTLRRLFVKEARALAQLSHPNVVAVHDVGEVDGRPFIVMEHVEGTSLKQRIERGGALPVADALRLTSEIAAGLAFAHSRGIIHADLKPSNILLDKNDRARICDFGIARTPQEDAETPQLFATALYVAPERVEGRSASVTSDVYGLGLVLYEMLVGRPPFTSTNPAVLLRDHVVRQPIPPSHLRQSLPKELDSIVLKALAKDPALRYQRASEVARALERIEDADVPLATTRVREADDAGTTMRVMTDPLHEFKPSAAQSPVVALLSTYGQSIRRGFFAFFAAVPVLALSLLAGFEAVPALLGAGLVAALALIGQLGLALAVGWVLMTILLFLFVPGLALLFLLMGLWLWLRDVPAERTALALAMPVAAPFGLAPALVLIAAAVQGLAGVVTAAWGAVLTVVFAVAAGRQALGAFVQTGLTLEQESLFSPVRAAESRSALVHVLQPSVNRERWEPLLALLDPATLWTQIAGIVSRLSGADVTALATVLAWAVAALVVWAITRLLRVFFDTLIRRRERWFTVYVFATAIGVTSGAMILYMLFIASSPLALAPGRVADGVLFVSAFTGAVLALAAGVVISATERQEPEPESGPALTGRRIPVR
ncbi:MAG: protein kinase domain-containing protein [Candidatus Limnocylindria bacterium]